MGQESTTEARRLERSQGALSVCYRPGSSRGRLEHLLITILISLNSNLVDRYASSARETNAKTHKLGLSVGRRRICLKALLFQLCGQQQHLPLCVSRNQA